jgi:hypothetical protein
MLGNLSQTQQAQGNRREDRQQSKQCLHAAQLPLLDPAAGFERVMELFQQPAPAIPLDPLPRLDAWWRPAPS